MCSNKRAVHTFITLVMQERPKKLLDQVRDAVWLEHRIDRTEKTSVQPTLQVVSDLLLPG